MSRALDNIRILDLSRVLAGPFCTQMLGDLGAEIIKIEKPYAGDDTRYWGPPFQKDHNGNDTTESAYYLSANRNKKSVAIDIKSPEGQKIIHDLIAHSDIIIENFKTGGLKKYGLDYNSLKSKHPQLIYCSITGFGQTGPLASEPGYDLLAQALSGLMACTGAPDKEPMKVGVALSDVMTGMNAAIAILAALHHRTQTGNGQHIDVALVDCTIASLVNIAQYYLTSGNLAPRHGNAHSTIVPYQVFEAQDGHVILAVGNDDQFARFCHFVDRDDLSANAKFTTNSSRVEYRDELVSVIADIISTQNVAYWVDGLREVNVPCSPVNTMDQTFAMDQVQHRNMQIKMPHPASGQEIDLVGSPLKLSETPVSYDHAPPACGQDTRAVLQDILGLDNNELNMLDESKVIQLNA